MKYILLTTAIVVSLVAVTYCAPLPTVTVEPAVNPNKYERPVKDGNCWLQKDTMGNTHRVCH